jgi:cell division protein FtsW
MPKKLVLDRWIFFTAGLLMVTGVLMVGSSSHYMAMQRNLGSSYFLTRQLVHALVAVVVLVVAMRFPYRKLKEGGIVFPALILCALALVVVLAMPAAGGAKRWLHFGLFRVQPSEFAKLATILFMARFLALKEKRINDMLAVTLPGLSIVATLAFLIVIEPDLGGAVMLTATACVMIFVAGLRWRYVAAVTGFGMAALVLGILIHPYRLRRILAYINPDADPMAGGWQLTQSMVAIGNGGLTGTGFGKGQAKALFLPEAHTDFIYSIVSEEFGFLGSMLLLAAFMLLLWRGLRTARMAPDRHGFYLALGITTLLVLQGVIHMGVCVGLFPTKGLSLPFVSYGGSSLVVSMAATGILLNVSRYSN